MKGYYIRCSYIEGGYDTYRDFIEHGIFLNKKDAEAKVVELHKLLEKDWKEKILEDVDKIVKQQKRWDVLEKDGLNEGPRPVIPKYPGEPDGWKPGIDGGLYYFVEEVEIHTPKAPKGKKPHDKLAHWTAASWEEFQEYMDKKHW